MANYNRPANAFPKGNQLYKKVTGIGRKRKFSTPGAMWLAAREYFIYCMQNPLPYWISRKEKMVMVYKKSPFSITGFCLYVGLSHLNYYKKLPGYQEVLQRINAVIYVHNFTAAAAGILNGSMIGQSLRQTI